MQKRYDAIVKEFSKRHDNHSRRLPEFGKTIEHLPADKTLDVTMQILKKFNQEVAIINQLKRMRKSFSQLKFRLWDMETCYSGSILDTPKDEGDALKLLQRIVGNIEDQLSVFGIIKNTTALNKYSGRRVAHIVLDTVKPDAKILTALQTEMRNKKILMPGFFKSVVAFDDVILKAPVNFLPQSK